MYFFSPQHMSAVRSFKTAPPVGSDVSFKFIAYGDMGVYPGSRTTAKYVSKDVQDGYEFIFHNGDISYARGMVRRKSCTFLKFCTEFLIFSPQTSNSCKAKQNNFVYIRTLSIQTIHFSGVFMGSMAFPYSLS